MKTSDWVIQWKMKFNPDSQNQAQNQAQEVIFSRKSNKIDHSQLYFN